MGLEWHKATLQTHSWALSYNPSVNFGKYQMTFSEWKESLLYKLKQRRSKLQLSLVAIWRQYAPTDIKKEMACSTV